MSFKNLQNLKLLLVQINMFNDNNRVVAAVLSAALYPNIIKVIVAAVVSLTVFLIPTKLESV